MNKRFGPNVIHRGFAENISLDRAITVNKTTYAAFLRYCLRHRLSVDEALMKLIGKQPKPPL